MLIFLYFIGPLGLFCLFPLRRGMRADGDAVDFLVFAYLEGGIEGGVSFHEGLSLKFFGYNQEVQ